MHFINLLCHLMISPSKVLFVHIVNQMSKNVKQLRYHGSWIFEKNAKNLFFAVQIEKTETNNLQKE